MRSTSQSVAGPAGIVFLSVRAEAAWRKDRSTCGDTGNDDSNGHLGHSEDSTIPGTICKVCEVAGQDFDDSTEVDARNAVPNVSSFGLNASLT